MQNIIMDDLMRTAVSRGASDLHIKVGRPPILRINGVLYDLEYDPLDPRTARNLVYSLIENEQQEEFERIWEFDFAYECEDAGRFRVNLHKDRGFVGASLRVISSRIPSLKELSMPDFFGELALRHAGLVIVTGPTGSGKSTTLASMIDVVNTNRGCHIVTIEDPVEYLHVHKKSIVTQREVGNDTKSFADALKRVLRQDPDVVLVGEIRDPESAGMAITAAETGHLVLTTLHTVDSPQTIDRIVDMFNPNQQPQIRMQLSGTLQAVISQRLLPRCDREGRIPSLEIMLASPAVRANIRKGDTHLLYSTIQTSKQAGMQTMNQCLKDLILNKKITRETALDFSYNPDELRQLLGMPVGNQGNANNSPNASFR